MKRRTFLGAAAAPAILGAADKGGTKNPVLGSGAHQYEAIHDWGELPKSMAWGNCHGVCEDKNGNIYVHHTVHKSAQSRDTMVVFDSKGKFITSWGAEYDGGAHGLHLVREGKDELFVLCDVKNNKVVKTNLKGEKIWEISYPEDSPAYAPGPDGAKKRWKPTNVATAPNGDVYVADGYGSHYIIVYDKNGKYRFTFGGKSNAEPGNTKEPHGIICDTRDKGNPTILVADRGNNRLQRFTLDGKHLGFDQGVKLPCHLWNHKDLMVIPDLSARVTLIDRNNQVITHLGDDNEANDWRDLRKKERAAFRPGKFVCPHGACFDRKGNIYVAEWVEVGRVTKLRKL